MTLVASIADLQGSARDSRHSKTTGPQDLLDLC